MLKASCIVLLASLLVMLSHADSVDDLVKREMKTRRIQGAVVGVIQNGKVVKKRTYGFANIELGVKMRVDSVFEIGSITKQFTATLIMMGVEEGKLRLDQPISDILPGLPEAWKPITVRHLLGHMSGLKNINDLPNYGIYDELDYAKFIAGLKDLPLEFEPGTRYAYRNTGYCLAGYIIEQLWHKPYWEVLNERIFKPLKMTRSEARNPRKIIKNRVAGYSIEKDTLVNRGTNLTDISSAGAIASNLDDLIKWNTAIDNGKLLKPESQNQMWTSNTLTDGKLTNYGLGWGINTYRGVRLISHGGSTAGFSASISKFVDQKITVIVLTNCETLNNATDIARAIAGVYIQFPAK
jgi:CubicO group peptidase (beta-lactamase class C family)